MIRAVLTAVLVAMVVGSGAYAAWALKRNRRRHEHPASNRGPAEARTHDVISHLGRDWLVEGVVQLDEGGKRRRLARLVDGRDTTWLLSAEGELALLAPTTDAPPLPPPDTLLVAGETFRLIEAGGGRVARHGDVGPRAMERCRYWRYQGPGTRRAWLDEFRAAELLVGDAVSEGVLELLPGT